MEHRKASNGAINPCFDYPVTIRSLAGEWSVRERREGREETPQKGCPPTDLTLGCDSPSGWGYIGEESRRVVARHKPVHIAPARDHDWQADSDMIFTQITSGDFPTFELANQAVCLFYVPDMKISRGGIAHALGRLEKHYQDHPTIPVARAGGEA